MPNETKSAEIKSQAMKDASYKFQVKDSYMGANDGTAYYRKPLESGNGVSETAFMNFWPELVELKRVDDGFTPRDYITFRAYRNGKYEPPVDLEKKDILSNQPHAKFSPGCRIGLGRGNAARCGELMLMQCEDAETKIVYAHTGWRIIDGERVFLNGGYSVTAAGLTDRYTVDLDPDLARCYRFIAADDAATLPWSVLELMDSAAPDWLVVPSLAYVFLTPLNEMMRSRGAEPCFTFYLIGKTGSHKSSWAKIMLSFFGGLGYAETAPMTFDDTANSIGRKLGIGADIPLLLDDRKQTTTFADKAKYESIEKFVSAAIGDRAARGRLNTDGTAKRSYTPKCNLIITAEEAFQNIGISSVARSVSVDMTPDTLPLASLIPLQDRAADLNRIGSAYIQWLIQNYDVVSDSVTAQTRAYRERFTDAGHDRLATAFSQLLFSYSVFLRFLIDRGAIDPLTVREREQRAIEIFLEMCERQSRKVENERPTRLFVELLEQMLETGQVRLCDLRKEKDIGGDTINLQTASAHTVGYRDADYIYLIKDQAFSEVVRFYAQTGNTFPSSAAALWRAFQEEGKILPNADGKRPDRRKAIHGQQRWYIWLRADVLDDTDIQAEEVS